jgi:thioesterase domain-containing protein
MIPKRPFWLATGAAIGAGSSLWIERRVRRTVQEAARRLQPDALAVEIGRSAREIAESTSERVRSAVSVGRDEMRQHEEQLWQDLSERRSLPPPTAHPVANQYLEGAMTEEVTGTVEAPRPSRRPDSTGRTRGRPRVAETKSRSHLGN